MVAGIMWQEDLFRTFGLIVVMAAVFVMAGRFIRMPAIVVYLVAGLVIGPGLGLVEMNFELKMISEMGIALLLFLVGLELSFDKIRNVGKLALVAGVAQVLITAAAGFGVSKLLGFGLMEALFIGMGITFSSTVIAVKLLTEKRELDTSYGHIAVACSLVQSLLVILVLSILNALGGGGGGGAAGVLLDIGKAFGSLLLLAVGVLLVADKLLGRPFAWAARSPEVLIIWSLSWCFSIILIGDLMGLSLEICSFLAGLALAQLPHNVDLHRRLQPLMNLLMAVFFVSLGIPMVFDGIGPLVPAALILSLLVVIVNISVYTVIIPRFGYGVKTALLTGLTGAQISEFSFILAALGHAKGLIGAEIIALMTLIGLATMGGSAYLILHNHRIHDWVNRLGVLRWRVFNPRADTEAGVRSTGIKDHVIIVGMNTLGRHLVRELTDRGEVVLAIDSDARKLRDLPGISLIGNTDYPAVLEDAGLAKARLLVSALNIEDANDLLAYHCRAARVPCAINVVDLSVVDELLDLGVTYLMIPKVDGVKAQIARLREMGFLNPASTARMAAEKEVPS